MRFEMSKAVAVQASDIDKAYEFYGKVLGFPIDAGNSARKIDAAPFEMYIDQQKDCEGILLELKVDDVERAREHLEAHGCRVIRWQGAGGACFVEDPFGVRFNLWQNS